MSFFFDPGNYPQLRRIAKAVEVFVDRHIDCVWTTLNEIGLLAVICVFNPIICLSNARTPHEVRCRNEDLPIEYCSRLSHLHVLHSLLKPRPRTLMDYYSNMAAKLHNHDNNHESDQKPQEDEEEDEDILDNLINHGQVLDVVSLHRPHFASQAMNHIWLLDD